MYLPKSDSLAIDVFSGLFADMSESYKIFWFNGILDGITKGNDVQTFEQIINHMVVDAWYMVTEYHLNLGPSDALEKLIHLLQQDTGLPSNAKQRDILLALENNQNREIRRMKMFSLVRYFRELIRDVRDVHSYIENKPEEFLAERIREYITYI